MPAQQPLEASPARLISRDGIVKSRTAALLPLVSFTALVAVVRGAAERTVAKPEQKRGAEAAAAQRNTMKITLKLQDRSVSTAI